VRGGVLKKWYLIIGGVLTVIVLLGLLIIVIPLLTAKPTITVDYVSEYNRITQPANYDPNENAAFDYEKAYEAFVEMPEVIKENKRLWPGDLKDNELDTLRNWIASNSETLCHLQEAIGKPYYWIERNSQDGTFRGMDCPELPVFRDCAELVLLQGKLKAYEGDVEGGLETILDSHKIGLHLSNKVLLVEHLVGMAACNKAFRAAFLILDRTEVEAETLANFQGQLEEPLEQIERLNFINGERIYFLDAVQRVFSDNGKGDGKLIPAKLVKYQKEWGDSISLLKAILICMNHPGRGETLELSEKLYKEAGEVLNETPWELHQREMSYYEHLGEIIKNNYLLSYSPPAFGLALELCLRGKALGEALETVVALLRHKADIGKFPESLEELVRGNYISKLPIDPYGPSTLVYRRTNGNFTLYSRGVDFEDDGGTYSNWGKYGGGGDQVFWPVEEK
jgi:hypothetical protein